MRRRHITQVAAIERRVYDRPWSAGLFESELAQEGRHYVTVWPDGRVRRTLLGYGGVMVAVGEAHITTVVVDPDLQRSGIGARIVLDLMEAAVRMGAGAATLEVRAGNTRAQRLYSSFGFAPVGVRPGYYSGSNEDAIIMWVYDIESEAFAARLDARRAALAGAIVSTGVHGPADRSPADHTRAQGAMG
jgi:ribosomal-protein-alanine N-acetyltransferase